MQRSVTIEGKRYKSVVKGWTFMLYRKFFRSDLLKDFYCEYEKVMDALVEQVASKGNLEPEDLMILMVKTVDHEFLMRLGYCALRAGDPNLTDYESFIGNIEDLKTYIVYCVTVFDDLWTTNFPVEQPEEKDESNQKKTS